MIQAAVTARRLIVFIKDFSSAKVIQVPIKAKPENVLATLIALMLQNILRKTVIR